MRCGWTSAPSAAARRRNSGRCSPRRCAPCPSIWWSGRPERSRPSATPIRRRWRRPWRTALPRRRRRAATWC
ncbi:hypothetical protein E0493_01950 [Roseomonas sp. M0104]|uniref:Uncharacterized protein n=1 Tax=Teichococcus coralli TaxID=2545983 RepID=A0A845B637_9PROT|nr:hypothetical protein [Pseudoroseomonas coralli]